MCRSRKMLRQAQSPRAIIQPPLCRSQQQLPRPRRRRLKPSARLLLQPTRNLPRRRHLLVQHKRQRLPPSNPQLLRPDLRRNRPRLRSHRHQPRPRPRSRKRHQPPRLPKPRLLVLNPLGLHLAQKRAPANLTLQKRHPRPRHLLDLIGPLSHPSHPRLSRVLPGHLENDLARTRPRNLRRTRQRSGSAILCPPSLPSRWSRSASKAQSHRRSQSAAARAGTRVRACNRKLDPPVFRIAGSR
jgi:hypothetical protein